MSEEEEDADLGWDAQHEEPPPAGMVTLDYDYDKLPSTSPSAFLDYDHEPHARAKRGAGTARIVIIMEYAYGVLGLLLGLCCIVGGCVLGLNGVAGATSWTASVLGAESTINDAAPGVVLFVVGVFLVWITKPKVKARNLP